MADLKPKRKKAVFEAGQKSMAPDLIMFAGDGCEAREKPTACELISQLQHLRIQGDLVILQIDETGTRLFTNQSCKDFIQTARRASQAILLAAIDAQTAPSVKAIS